MKDPRPFRIEDARCEIRAWLDAFIDADVRNRPRFLADDRAADDISVSRGELLRPTGATLRLMTP